MSRFAPLILSFARMGPRGMQIKGRRQVIFPSFLETGRKYALCCFVIPFFQPGAGQCEPTDTQASHCFGYK